MLIITKGKYSQDPLDIFSNRTPGPRLSWSWSWKKVTNWCDAYQIKQSIINISDCISSNINDNCAVYLISYSTLFIFCLPSFQWVMKLLQLIIGSPSWIVKQRWDLQFKTSVNVIIISLDSIGASFSKVSCLKFVDIIFECLDLHVHWNIIFQQIMEMVVDWEYGTHFGTLVPPPFLYSTPQNRSCRKTNKCLF